VIVPGRRGSRASFFTIRSHPGTAHRLVRAGVGAHRRPALATPRHAAHAATTTADGAG